MRNSPEKYKIAILGGGPAGLSAAFALTRNAETRDRLEVTVYQTGWRLGGKCASGFGDRIEEHGLHVWAGFYDHAFDQIRECCDVLGLNWKDAFEPVDDVIMREHHNGEWKAWSAHVNRRTDEPGLNSTVPTVWDIVKWLNPWITDSPLQDDTFGAMKAGPYDEMLAAATSLDVATHIPPLPAGDGDPPSVNCKTAALCLRDGVANLPDDPSLHQPGQHRAILTFLDALREAFEAYDGANVAALSIWDDIRRGWLGFRIATAISRGIFIDGLLKRGLSAIDHVELRAWLQGHGASKKAVYAAFVTAGYDWAFAYDGETPSLAAGVGLQGFFRLVLGYRGALFWMVRGSLADRVYAPMYKVLKARGVKFRFFHRVADLELDDRQSFVERIHLVEQAGTDNGADYDPLVAHSCGFDVWPPKPAYAGLRDGASLEALVDAGQVDLEGGAATDNWYGKGSRTLVARATHRDGDGVDESDVFDDVILAIPPAAQRIACARLAKAKPRWKRMLDGIGSAKTLAMQLWFLPTLPGMGHTDPGRITTAYQWPFSTWADMSQLLPIEPKPAGKAPESIVYLCGNAPSSTPDQPAAARQFAREQAEAWLDRCAGAIWPLQKPSKGPGTFDYDKLYDPKNAPDKRRLDSQYIRANVRPSDLYVLSLPGTTALRMRANRSGIDNLFLAGDWVRTELSAGCVEAAVNAGEEAAAAVIPRLP